MDEEMYKLFAKGTPAEIPESKDWRSDIEVGSAFIQGNQCTFTKADQSFEINNYRLSKEEVKLLKLVYEDAVKLGHIEE